MPGTGPDRDALEDLYGAYGDRLDEGELDGWLELFAADSSYRAVSRENWEQGLPLSTIWCESKGMLVDRVMAVRGTTMFIPRTLRHLVGRLRIEAMEAGWSVAANFLVAQTLPDEPTTLFAAGRYYDVVVAEDGDLRFRRKVAVYDAALIATSLVYPL